VILALAVTGRPFSDTNRQLNVSDSDTSFATRNGSIIEVRQAIGKPSKIRKLICVVFTVVMDVPLVIRNLPVTSK
jgi:hypothetical protein